MVHRQACALILAAAIMLTGCAAQPATAPTTTTEPVTTTSPVTTTTTTSTTTTLPVPPAPSVGDPYFPQLGSLGFDTEHYAIEMTVDPDDGVITDAAVTITAAALQDLSSIDLDLVGLEVIAVRLDGLVAPFERSDGKLTITAPSLIPAGETFVIRVEYRGRPEPFIIPGFDTRAGWVVTSEGVHVVAQPDGARTWFPGNDHPSDKALFTIAVTVPEPFVVVSNGTLSASSTDGSGNATFVWDMDAPMATYLATIVIGDLVTVEGGGPEGVSLADHLPTDLATPPPAVFGRTAEMIGFLEDWFGPYPFSSYGHVVVPDFAIALETQTMTVIGRRAISERTVVHEVAHQWYGNSVSVATWQDIWLSEGFASFAELLWIEWSQGIDAMNREIQRRHAILAGMPHRPISDPLVEEMFGTAVYWRGSLTLHALRRAVGDDRLAEVLHEHAARHRHANASTRDFIAVVEDVTGRDLAALFDEWLHESALPPLPG